METLITKGIKVSVENFYQSEPSRPAEARFIFSYKVTIENLSPHTVQLLRRYWNIWDANGIVRDVEGDGVIGQQPVLHPGESHQYTSWSHLTAEIGQMSGYYLMANIETGEPFQVGIPSFRLIVPFKLN